METPDQSGAGYPEEAPDSVADDEPTPQEQTSGDKGRADEPESEPDKATGNPDAAG